jgi:hypothetical protein
LHAVLGFSGNPSSPGNPFSLPQFILSRQIVLVEFQKGLRDSSIAVNMGNSGAIASLEKNGFFLANCSCAFFEGRHNTVSSPLGSETRKVELRRV